MFDARRQLKCLQDAEGMEDSVYYIFQELNEKIHEVEIFSRTMASLIHCCMNKEESEGEDGGHSKRLLCCLLACMLTV